jgi:hypothetical protein
MKLRTILSLASVFLFLFTAAVWSQPLPADTTSNLAPDSQSITGKISEVGDDSFSIEIQKDKSVSTMQFLMDGNTKVEGKLAVGSKAAVQYKSDSGKNVATVVVVAPVSTQDRY